MKTSLQHPVFDVISRTADRMGVEAYVVGGWVRDLLMGRSSSDIDIMVVGSGVALAQEVSLALDARQKLQVFKRFGTAMLRHGGWDVEFVGARRESYRADSRKPVVEDGSLQDDLNRRDFTINAMAIGLNRDNFGELLDPFGGQADLERKLLRTPLDPDTTYSDDPLRMMRAVRFAARLASPSTPLPLRRSGEMPAGWRLCPWNGSWRSSIKSCSPAGRQGASSNCGKQGC